MNVVLTSKNRRFKNVFGEGLTHVEFDLDKDCEYFRITVMDDKGGRANTNAYFESDFRD